MYSGRRPVATFCFLFLLTIATSQCFAKSSAKTADDETLRERQYLDLIKYVFQYIQYNYVEEIDPEVLYKGAMKGMLDSLGDQHTAYLDTDAWRDITDTTQGNFGGVGLTISKPVASTAKKPAYVEVAQPIEGSPGDKAGIRAGDKIIEINGTDTATLTMEQVLGMLRGTVGESVTVKILRGETTEFECTLVRDIIENPTVKFGMIDKTGYVKITGFSTTTAAHVQEALDFFKKNDYTSLIIDLRYNGGGLITAAVDVADKFIDKGPIVSTKSRLFYNNSVYTANSLKTKVKKGIPIIVLINEGTASASEIVSGALKDNHLAYLVGTKTYGKGSVQTPSPLTKDDGFKLTIARYYSPSDTNIDKIGIPPDREVTFPALTEDEQKAYADLIESGEVEQYVEAHPSMTEDDIAEYAATLQKNYAIESSLLRKIIRNEVDRTRPARLYDLDYDVQLREALRIIKEENFDNLIKSTKTLKELQDEVKTSQESSVAETGN
ncbi:MAG: S41 family peptidase [Treponema sp.]|nr:S41 family peptidase [Treponema sp.]